MIRTGHTILLAAIVGLTGCQSDESASSVAFDAFEPEVGELTEACFHHWQLQAWRIGENAELAANHDAFRAGIRNVCQARAELYLEGYEIFPFIDPNAQQAVYPMVFNADIESIKAHIRAHLPALQLI